MTAYDERSGYKERLEKAEAEIARLTEENAELKEFDLTKSDAEWREIYDDQLKRTGFFSGQLTEAKAEIERLEDDYAELRDTVDELLGEIQGLRAELEQAMIAALREKIQ